MKLKIMILAAGGVFAHFVAQSQTAQTPTPPPAASGTVRIENQNNNAVNQNQATLPSGVQRMEGVSPAIQNRLQARTAAGQTNAAAANGQFMATNGFAGTNSGFRTNTPGWTPTGRVETTNRMFGSNFNNGSFSNQTGIAFQDRGMTATDQTLLVQVRQTVLARLQPLGAWSPAVHFQINNGVVTLLGVVTTIQISQQIETTVTQVPGVVRVINRLAVGNTGTGPVPTVQTNAPAF
jgi:osmotically-inducible protein OsmY